MYETNKKDRGLEYKAGRGAYYKVPTGYAGDRITRYAAPMSVGYRYVAHLPIETREKALKRQVYENLIYGTRRTSRYGPQ